MCRVGKQYTVVGDDCNRVAIESGKTADQGGAKMRFKFIKDRIVNDTGDNFFDVIGLAFVFWNNTVNFLGVKARR